MKRIHPQNRKASKAFFIFLLSPPPLLEKWEVKAKGELSSPKATQRVSLSSPFFLKERFTLDTQIDIFKCCSILKPQPLVPMFTVEDYTNLPCSSEASSKRLIDALLQPPGQGAEVSLSIQSLANGHFFHFVEGQMAAASYKASQKWHLPAMKDTSTQCPEGEEKNTGSGAQMLWDASDAFRSHD